MRVIEITPLKTLQALSLINDNPTKTNNLGEIMEEGFPACGTQLYSQSRVGPGTRFGENMVIGMKET